MALTIQDVQLDWLREAPHNPRVIDPARFEQLKRSLQSDPVMLRARPIIALPTGEVVAGNMRLRAARDLGWETIPTVYADLNDQRAREWMLRDNNEFGSWVDDSLAALLSELETDGTDLSLLGFEAGELDRLLAQADGRVVDPDAAAAEWQGMPEFDQPDAMSYRTLAVHFLDDLAAQEFGRLVGQQLTDQTKFIWYPEQKPQRRLGEQYVSDEP